MFYLNPIQLNSIQNAQFTHILEVNKEENVHRFALREREIEKEGGEREREEKEG